MCVCMYVCVWWVLCGVKRYEDWGRLVWGPKGMVKAGFRPRYVLEVCVCVCVYICVCV